VILLERWQKEEFKREDRRQEYKEEAPPSKSADELCQEAIDCLMKGKTRHF